MTTYLESNPAVQVEDVKRAIEYLAQPCSALLSDCKLRHLVGDSRDPHVDLISHKLAQLGIQVCQGKSVETHL